MTQDGRYALTIAWKNPGVAAIVIVTLALGIGTATALFSVFYAVVVRPLPYPSPARLMWLSMAAGDADPGWVTGPDFVEWREQSASFERLVAYATADATLHTSAGATRARVADVTADFWDVSGVHPSSGRLPLPGERDIVLLSQQFARRWYSDKPDLVGSTVILDRQQVTIVGVMPQDFRFDLPSLTGPKLRAKDVDVYRFVSISPSREGLIRVFNVVGRLKAGVSAKTAGSEIEAIQARIALAHPNPYVQERQRQLRIVPLHDQLTGNARVTLWILVAAAILVLAIACANVAGLLLARAETRRKEIAIRISLGATRARILRQCLVESLTLALPASALGVLIANAGVAMIVHFGPEALPRLAEVSVDTSALAVALGLGMVTALVFGFCAGRGLVGNVPNSALKEGSNSVIRGDRVGGVIVGIQLALALVLLTGAGLMVKSAWRMNAHPVGFDPARILTMKLRFVGTDYAESSARQSGFIRELTAKLNAIPGVAGASISTHGELLAPSLVVEGQAESSRSRSTTETPILINATSAALPGVMGLRLARRRWFADHEANAVINEAAERRAFHGVDAVGQRISLAGVSHPVTVVGVVADLKYAKLDAAPEPEVSVPFAQVDNLFGFFAVVRAERAPAALVPAMRALVAKTDSSQTPDDIMTLEQALAESIAPRRWNLFLLATFAAIALSLALIGVYGLMAYWVSQRSRDVSIRMALGAQRREAAWIVIRHGMHVALCGIAAGVIAALIVTRLMSALLYDVTPTDPLTFVAVVVGLATTALLACCVPAVRASLMDPMSLLRRE